MTYQPDLRVVYDRMDVIFIGLKMTLIISSIAMGLALVVGLVVALIRISKVPVLSTLGSIYVQFFRGIPQYVFILWLYYGLAMLTGINFRPLEAGILALMLQYGGFMSETFRAGIQAIGKGQSEAAISVGMTKRQTYQYIVLPQALRIMIPPLGNSYIGMLKDSSLVSVIGVMELMRVTSVQANLYFRPFEFYTLAALIYILLTFVFSEALRRVEIRLKF
jgi:His/Glu/Gln/Arg/opine family amino acid ABC transporter permease subunit